MVVEVLDHHLLVLLVVLVVVHLLMVLNLLLPHLVLLAELQIVFLLLLVGEMLVEVKLLQQELPKVAVAGVLVEQDKREQHHHTHQELLDLVVLDWHIVFQEPL